MYSARQGGSVMDRDDKKQLLNHLESLIAEQDKAIAKGDKYINKNWRLITKGKIELLKQSIKE